MPLVLLRLQVNVELLVPGQALLVEDCQERAMFSRMAVNSLLTSPTNVPVQVSVRSGRYSSSVAVSITVAVITPFEETVISARKSLWMKNLLRRYIPASFIKPYFSKEEVITLFLWNTCSIIFICCFISFLKSFNDLFVNAVSVPAFRIDMTF